MIDHRGTILTDRHVAEPWRENDLLRSKGWFGRTVLLSATFADYLMPTTFEVPLIRDTEHCTPSPLTSHGQKGSGEGGYLGAPAAVASAVNDALSARGVEIDQVPMRMSLIEELLNGTP